MALFPVGRTNVSFKVLNFNDWQDLKWTLDVSTLLLNFDDHDVISIYEDLLELPSEKSFLKMGHSLSCNHQ